MKKITTAFAAAGIAAGIALGVAPAANADAASYIYDLEQSGYGFTGQKGTYLAWGVAICNDEARGFSRDQIIRNVINGNNLSVNAAVFVVEAAEIHLC